MIPVFRPSMDQKEIKAVSKVLLSGWIGLGPKTKEFESDFAKYIGVKYASGLNSATAALHLGLEALDVSGGEVITTPMTFVSSNHAIIYNKAIPVFCDIERDTLNIDTDKIEPLITKKTKAILVVHYGGYPVDMDKVLKIAKKHKLKVVEDVAHGCGGEYKGRKLGSIGDIGCFSFHAVKNLAAGDGGMVTTNDRKLYDRITKMRWVGITKDTWSRELNDERGYSWCYDVVDFGFKYHMNDITAAIGLVQLSKLKKANARRAEISKMYSQAFSKISEIQIPVIKPYMTKPAYHNYVIKCDKRDRLNEFLKKRGISTGIHYIPNNHYDIYKNFRGETPVAREVWKKLLTLPVYPTLKNSEVRFIIEEVKKCITHKG